MNLRKKNNYQSYQTENSTTNPTHHKNQILIKINDELTSVKDFKKVLVTINLLQGLKLSRNQKLPPYVSSFSKNYNCGIMTKENVHIVNFQLILNPFMLMQNRQEYHHAITHILTLADTIINAYSIYYGSNAFHISNKVSKL